MTYYQHRLAFFLFFLYRGANRNVCLCFGFSFVDSRICLDGWHVLAIGKLGILARIGRSDTDDCEGNQLEINGDAMLETVRAKTKETRNAYQKEFHLNGVLAAVCSGIGRDLGLYTPYLFVTIVGLSLTSWSNEVNEPNPVELLKGNNKMEPTDLYLPYLLPCYLHNKSMSSLIELNSAIRHQTLL